MLATAIICALASVARGQKPVPACTLSCENAVATGQFSTALGFNTTASGIHSTALGDGCVASGKSATALGHMTAADVYSTSMGYKTLASHTGSAFGYFTSATGLYSAAFGNYIGTAEKESLAVSGKIHATNVHLNIDDRFATNVTTTSERAVMLEELRALELVEYSPSTNLCKHDGVDARACAKPALRTVGLLASKVSDAIPNAVKTTQTSRRLTLNKLQSPDDRDDEAHDHPVIEDVENIRALDLTALLTRMVGSIQVLDQKLQAAQQEVSAQRAEIAELRAVLTQQ